MIQLSEKKSGDTQTEVKVEWRVVLPEEAGQRLDNFLQRVRGGVPKTRIYRAIRKGEVRVDKGRVKPDTRLEAGVSVRIPPLRVLRRLKQPEPQVGAPDYALQLFGKRAHYW